MSKSRVVIVGGGFAGIEALRSLTRAGYQVTLIDKKPYSTFQPLLYQVATGGLNPGDVTYPLRRLVAGRARFRRATVLGIDTERRLVNVSKGDPVPYDVLILAQGAGPHFFEIPGAAEHAHLTSTRGSALRVRDLVYSGLEALTGASPDARYTVVIVGGGPTGVEMAGALAELKSQALPDVFPELATDAFRVVLVEMSDRLLGPFQAQLQDYTKRQLRVRGVDVRLDTAVAEITPTRVVFKDGSGLDADLVIWASGVGAVAGVEKWGMPQGQGGRIEVDANLQVKGHQDIFAVGDAAIVTDDPSPQLAPAAQQMGKHVAKQIKARDTDHALTPFTYFNKGTMATIARNSAVAEFPNGWRFTGFPAWVMWVVLHLALLLGGRNRLEAMINMAFRYFDWPQSAVGIVGDVTGNQTDPAPKD